VGPLAGIRVLEIGGIGPNPFAGMLLADMGADVLRIDRPGGQLGLQPGVDPTLRSRQTISMDLRSEAGREAVYALAQRADALIEGFRPGAMERLGLGPVELHARNPRLVYGRMTGYGQIGPMAGVAGHDINYIALSGALGATRRQGQAPMFALNLVGDYGGGAMFLAFGVVCALLEARASGQGQVIDAAMVDGAALLTALIHGLHAAGGWSDEPGTNLLDSGAHFYEVYATADGGHMAVGALEPQFYARLLALLQILPEEMPQFDRARWPEFKERFQEIFATRTTAEWAELFESEDACVTAVRGLFGAAGHPHLVARRTFVELDGVPQPGPAPRFSRTAAEATPAGRDPEAALARWGLSQEERAAVDAAAAEPPA
jgi:alpha-methylacyl-CoA racemase